MKHVKNQKRGLTFFNKSLGLWCYWKVERLYNKEYGEISSGDLYRKTLEHLALKRSLKTAGAGPWGEWTILRQIWVRKGHTQAVLRPRGSGRKGTKGLLKGSGSASLPTKPQGFRTWAWGRFENSGCALIDLRLDGSSEAVHVGSWNCPDERVARQSELPVESPAGHH